MCGEVQSSYLIIICFLKGLVCFIVIFQVVISQTEDYDHITVEERLPHTLP